MYTQKKVQNVIFFLSANMYNYEQNKVQKRHSDKFVLFCFEVYI